MVGEKLLVGFWCFTKTDGKPGKTLLWFLREEHLVQSNAKEVLEETRRLGDVSNVGSWLGKCKGSV